MQENKLINSLEDIKEDRTNWDYISEYQILSEDFIEKHLDKIDIDIYNKCHRKTTYNERLSDMTEYATKYALEFDGKTLIAYREHDKWGRGMFNKTIRYEVGKYYRDWHCNMNIEEKNSFGLGIFPKGNVKVSVDIDDWGLWLKNDDGKCRVWGFKVLEQN